MKRKGIALPICLLAAAIGLGSTAAAAADGVGSAEGRAHSYRDDAGLYVSSLEGGWEHPLTASLSLRLRALADWITILAPAAAGAAPHAGHDPSHQHMEEDDNPAAADAVSGASARVLAGASDARETRAGGGLGLSWHGLQGNRPVTMSLDARGSREPDYLSVGGTLSGGIALFQSNLVLSGFVGLGRDEIDPDRIPPGQTGLWPAAQSKVSGGFSASQTVTPRLVLSAGASAARQSGRLSSPYRNALVGITYFPERLPGSRLRATAFAGAALYLGWGSALHAREALYADDWGVRAWIPEMAIAKEFGRWLATVRHRFYAQGRADFYRPSYSGLTGYRTGDSRLGRLYDQTGALAFAYRLGPLASPINLSAEYSLSRLEYPDLYPQALWSHVFTFGIRTEY